MLSKYCWDEREQVGARELRVRYIEPIDRPLDVSEIERVVHDEKLSGVDGACSPAPPRGHAEGTRRMAMPDLYSRFIRDEWSEMQRDVRASDAERLAVVRRLELALRDGRLTIVEFDERAQAAYAARTRGELDDLIEDLPRDLW